MLSPNSPLYNFLYLFVAVLGLRCSAGFSLVAAIGVYSQALVLGFLTAAASLVVVRRLSCSAACESVLDQGSNPGLLHWQADSLPLNQQ